MPPPNEPIRVLHVDDEPDLADLAATFVEREDDRFHIETATNANEGRNLLASDNFDCVVSDYDMPGQNGIEFLESVRIDHPELPFILFTGKGSEEVASDAISAGVTDYLQKEGGTEQYKLLANRVLNAVEQYRSQQRAAKLDRIRTLASDINQALVRAESRAEVETRVCEIISEADPYLFAWIGGPDSETNRIEPRTWAGVEDDYLENITITADESSTGQGPGGTAIRERRVVISQDITDDPEFEPWQDEARTRGYWGVATIPLEYQNALYGELAVYAEKPNAFDEAERDLLAELGDDIAHALHSFEIQDRLRTERDRRQALVKNAPAPVLTGEIDLPKERHIITEVNDAFEDVFGYDAESIIGQDVVDVVVPDNRSDQTEELRKRTVAGETVIREVERITTDGPRTFLLTIVPFGTDQGQADGWYAWYTDITERKQREQEFEQTNTVLRTILEALPMGVLVEDVERDILMANDTLCEVMGLPLAAEDLIGRDCEEAAVELKDLFADPDGFVNGIETRIEQREPVKEELTLADGRTLEREYIPYTLPKGEANLWLYSDVTGRQKREDALKQLHAATRDMMAATTIDEVTRLGSETAVEVLDLPLNGIHLSDTDDNELVPVAWSEETEAVFDGPPPAIPVAHSLAGEAYQTGEPNTYTDVREAEAVHNPETDIRSELYIPIGEDGVLVAGSTTIDDFDATDEALAHILATNLESALDRVEREQTLQRQNERLEKFTNVVSHDLRNPLNVAQARLELALEECDSDHLKNVGKAHERMETFIQDMLTLAREGEPVNEIMAVELSNIIDDCWQSIEAQTATLRLETTQTIFADPNRLRRLLENLFRNAVEHGGEDVTVTVGDLADMTGFYVTDDGPGIPEDELDEVFEAGYSTTKEGTGFGLNIVREIAEAHGWDIAVTDSEHGGARFEITGVEIAAE